MPTLESRQGNSVALPRRRCRISAFNTLITKRGAESSENVRDVARMSRDDLDVHFLAPSQKPDGISAMSVFYGVRSRLPLFPRNSLSQSGRAPNWR